MSTPKIDNDAIRNLLKENDKKNEVKKFEKDKRFYNSFQNLDNGFYNATIRFLPPSETYPLPFIEGLRHTVKKNKKLLIEECPRKHDKNIKCPVCEWVNKNWTTFDIEEQKGLKRKAFYVSNVYIVKDPQNPELEGKVLLFRYPKDIFKKLMSKYAPTEEAQAAGDEASDIFDYLEGRNFKLKISKQGNFWEFGNSAFDDVSKLCGGDEAKINTIHKSMFDLASLVSAATDGYDYDRVKSRLEYVLKEPMLMEAEGSDNMGSGSPGLKDENPATPDNEDIFKGL